MAPIRFPINDWDGDGSTDSLFDITMEMKVCESFQKEETDFLDELIPDVELSISDIQYENDAVDSSVDEEFSLESDDDYDWREAYKDIETYGVSPSEYKTQEEFFDAYNRAEEIHFQKLVEEHEKEMEEFEKKQKAFIEECKARDAKRRLEEQEEIRRNKEEDIKDKKEYIYCGVVFDDNSQVFHYITDDEGISVGDGVIVPVGYNNEETEAVVMSVEKCLRINAPYPFYKTKKIIRKM